MRVQSSEPPQPSLTNSDQFKENYDIIDWSKSTAEPVEVIVHSSGTTIKYERKGDNVRVHGIPGIRSDKPHYSESASIHVDQVADFNKRCVSGTHYDPATGALVSTSTRNREREARRRGHSFN